MNEPSPSAQPDYQNLSHTPCNHFFIADICGRAGIARHFLIRTGSLMKIETDLLYKSDHLLQKLDVMLPSEGGPFPVVVCIHGGGWSGGSKQGDMTVYGLALAQIGIAAVV